MFATIKVKKGKLDNGLDSIVTVTMLTHIISGEEGHHQLFLFNSRLHEAYPIEIRDSLAAYNADAESKDKCKHTNKQKCKLKLLIFIKNFSSFFSKLKQTRRFNGLSLPDQRELP